MNIINAENLTKSYTERKLLDKASFYLQEGEKVGVIGINGTGKSTLLKIIAGLEEPDEGQVTCANHIVVRYLPQNPVFDPEMTVLDSVLTQCVLNFVGSGRTERTDADAHAQEQKWSLESDAKSMMTRLGITDFTQKTGELSGGQRKRLALVAALLVPCDVLILDEPTNHLDSAMADWLENYLKKWRGALVMITHDRYFLDRIADKVVELDHGKATVFKGNYSDYAQKKELLRRDAIKQYENYQQTVRHQEQVIEKLRSFNREKSIKRAESREKMLEKMTPVDKPVTEQKSMHFSLVPEKESGKDVLRVENFGKSFGDLHLFQGVSFELFRGERVALIGKNGTGKTTLLKMLCELESPDQGTAVFGTNVELGYYDQEHNVLHEEKTIFDEIHDDYPDLNNTKIRNVLAAFLFTGEDVYKKISLLSGGEKGRVSLAKLMLSKANLLLLDEPTNHLDIDSKEILEDALNHYTGTVLYVSHDRYFIQKTATRILDLTNEHILSYDGNYDYYLAKKDLVESRYLGNTTESAPKTETPSTAKLDWKEQKEREAKKRKIETAYEKAENEIQKLEELIEETDAQIALPEYASNVAKLTELSKQKEQYEAELETAMEEWEKAAQALEELE